MQLTVDNVAGYLVGRGLMSQASIDEGAIRVVEVSRRNRNFKVSRGSLAGFFVKQARTPDPGCARSLVWEAELLRGAATARGTNALAALMPTFLDYDPLYHILILELFEESETLNEYHQRIGRRCVNAARLLGNTLGAHHAKLAVVLDPAVDMPGFPRQLPRVLSPERLGLYALKQAGTTAGMRLLEWFRRTPELIGHLDDLGRSWKCECLMHGDLKGDNCLFFHDKDGVLALRIVDWEHADFGDACWDLGGLKQDYFVQAMTAAAVERAPNVAEIVQRSLGEANRLQPILGEFWQSYVAARGIRVDAGSDMRARVFRCAAARMVQSAFEWAHCSPTNGELAVALLQISLGMFRDPISAADGLLGC